METSFHLLLPHNMNLLLHLYIEMLLGLLTQRNLSVRKEKLRVKSLDDFRSLQRSNKELRKQLEDQVLTIDKLHNENRATIEHHESEIKELKDSVASSSLDQLKELEILLDVKQKELLEVKRISAEQKLSIEDLNERLGASMQSCT